MEDPKRFRVNLLCDCYADLAFGYGPTVAEAKAVALKCFRKAHGRKAKIAEEIVEEITSDGARYEEVNTGSVSTP